MTTALVLHKVADYKAWRPIYDDYDDVRKEFGVTNAEVMRSQDDPRMVIVRHDFKDRSSADEFFKQPELRQTMSEAGVDESTLQIYVTEPA